MKIVSVVPIKLNNERLPGKNTRLLNGKPLLEYILDTLLKCNSIDERYVFCSNSVIEQFLNGKAKFLKRPDRLDLPTSNFSQIMDAFLDEICADIYVYAHATAPFVSIASIQTCLDAVISGQYDSAFTATKIQDFLWKNNEAMNFDPRNLPRSQDIEPIYRESSGVYVFSRESYRKTHSRVGDNPFICEIGYKEAIDINTYEDFELAEQMLK